MRIPFARTAWHWDTGPFTDHPTPYSKIGERKVPLRKNSRSWKIVPETELRAEEMT